MLLSFWLALAYELREPMYAYIRKKSKYVRMSIYVWKLYLYIIVLYYCVCVAAYDGSLQTRAQTSRVQSSSLVRDKRNRRQFTRI